MSDFSADPSPGPVRRLRLRSRRTIYTHVLALCLGTLLAALALPFAVGERVVDVAGGTSSDFNPVGEDSSSPSAVDATPGSADRLATDETGPETATRPAVGGDEPVVGTPTPSTPDGPLTASDVGVSPTAIKLGVLVPDLGAFSNIPGVGDSGFDERTYQGIYKAFAEDINARGGISGRKLELVYHTLHLEDGEQAQQQACVYFTQDQKVFAIFDSSGQATVDTLDCIRNGSGAPAIEQNSFPKRRYSRGMFTVLPTADRLFANYLDTFDRQGQLRGKKLGLVETAVDKDLIDELFMPGLKARGYELTHRSTLSDEPGDAGAQLPVEVNQMRAKGVQVVFLLSLAAESGLFVQAADKQDFRPLWLTTDFEGNTLDFTAGLFPANTRALGLTSERTGEWRTSTPEPAYDAKCRSRFNARSSIGTVRRGANNRDNPYEHVLKVCTHFDMLEAAASKAGAGLTRAAFISAMEGLGTISIGFSGAGSLRPGKADARDNARIVQFKASCPGDGRNCFYPVTDFSPLN